MPYTFCQTFHIHYKQKLGIIDEVYVNALFMLINILACLKPNFVKLENFSSCNNDPNTSQIFLKLNFMDTMYIG